MPRNDRKDNTVGETVKRRGGAKISLVSHLLACFLTKVLDTHHVIQVYYGNGMALCSAVGGRGAGLGLVYT